MRSSSPRPRPAKDVPRVPAWIGESDDNESVILSTRARLARNIANIPFPHKASPQTLKNVVKLTHDAIQAHPSSILGKLRTVDVGALSEQNRAALVDSHLLSLNHALAGRNRSALIDDRHTISVLINEEDHIRIQIILPGSQPSESWEFANAIDDALSEQVTMAFHPHYGYQTASLANVGTGFRLSVMVHLPALAYLGRIDRTWRSVEALGSVVRGLYGEGVESTGNIFQVSNATALGVTEKQIVGRIKAVATFLETEEQAAREIISVSQVPEIHALAAAAYRRLDGATQLTAAEAMTIASDIRLGSLFGYHLPIGLGLHCRIIASVRGSIGMIATNSERARDVFYEDQRRPALLRTMLREESARIHAPR